MLTRNRQREDFISLNRNMDDATGAQDDHMDLERSKATGTNNGSQAACIS